MNYVTLGFLMRRSLMLQLQQRVGHFLRRYWMRWAVMGIMVTQIWVLL